MSHFDNGKLVTDWWIEAPCPAYPGSARALRRWHRTADGWDYDDIVDPADEDLERALASNRTPT